MFDENRDRLVQETYPREIEELRAENERLRDFVRLYISTYVETQTHPTVVQEADCMNVARSLLT